MGESLFGLSWGLKSLWWIIQWPPGERHKGIACRKERSPR
jgi:hypothetical protein